MFFFFFCFIDLFTCIILYIASFAFLSIHTIMNADYSYGFSLTTFSPSGKLLQIEYALNAVTKGKMAVGIVGICLLSLAHRNP